MNFNPCVIFKPYYHYNMKKQATQGEEKMPASTKVIRQSLEDTFDRESGCPDCGEKITLDCGHGVSCISRQIPRHTFKLHINSDETMTGYYLIPAILLRKLQKFANLPTI